MHERSVAFLDPAGAERMGDERVEAQEHPHPEDGDREIKDVADPDGADRDRPESTDHDDIGHAQSDPTQLGQDDRQGEPQGRPSSPPSPRTGREPSRTSTAIIPHLPAGQASPGKTPTVNPTGRGSATIAAFHQPESGGPPRFGRRSDRADAAGPRGLACGLRI